MDKSLFPSSRGPVTDAVNAAGGRAYSLSSEEALAQYAATAMFTNTFYADGREQLDELLRHAANCDPVFVARAAVYSRENGWLKDAPAVLLAHVSTRFQKHDENGARRAFRAAFPRVVDNGKILRNFCQVIASNVVGRQNFGHTIRGVIDAWINGRSSEQLFRDSVGGDKPSMADVIKMTRPRPRTPAKEAELRYLIGRELKGGQFDLLSPLMQQYEAFKRAKNGNETVGELPRVDFRLLDSLNLTKEEWKQIARNAKWMMTRMNLNTFQRHGVFEDAEMVKMIADRLANKDEVLRSRNYPFQLFQAFKHANAEVPAKVRNALQDAMEHAIANTPEFDGNIVLALDVSGSMHGATVGGRAGKGGVHTGGVSAIEVASLFAAAIMRRNPEAKLLPFSDRLNTTYRVNPRDSVMTITGQLSKLPSGGTDCSLPFRYLNGGNEKKAMITGVDAVICISDNESWVDSSRGYAFSLYLGGSSRTVTNNMPTGMMAEWGQFKKRNPNAKLICMDLVPHSTTQGPNGKDRLNIGGFNDKVFDVVAAFIKSGDGQSFVNVIKAVDLDQPPPRV